MPRRREEFRDPGEILDKSQSTVGMTPAEDDVLGCSTISGRV